MKGIRALTGLAGCLWVVLLSCSLAWAQDEQPEDPSVRAAELAQQAADRYAAGDVDGALAMFREAFTLVRDPAFAFNMAYIYEEIHVYPQAYHYYRQYLDIYPRAPNLDEVESKLAEMDELLAAEYAQLIITTTPEGAEVVVQSGGRSEIYGVTPVRSWVAPGAISITATLEGYQPTNRQYNAVAGVRLEVDMGQLTPAAVIGDDDDGGGSNVAAIAGWSLIGVGAVATVVGVLQWMSAQDSADQWDALVQTIGDDDPDTPEPTEAQIDVHKTDAEDASMLGNILFGAGVACIVGGAALLIFGGEDESEGARTEPQTRALIGPSGDGLAFFFFTEF